LAKEISNITPEDKTAILDSLKNDPEETLTKEEKQSILDDLKKELISAE